VGEEAARAHVDRFNTAVVTGDWSALIASLHPDAVMTFIGPPAGPFIGRDAIAAAYAANPPDDTLRVREIYTAGDAETVAFEWSRGGTGVLEIQRAAGGIVRLLIRFD
jgi:ketosteroid isomerase-like protein